MRDQSLVAVTAAVVRGRTAKHIVSAKGELIIGVL
jgi:hypothetical protein